MKAIIVSNAGPVIALASINRLGLLKNMFRQIFIPEKVEDEIIAGGITGAGVEAYKAANWIR